MEVIDIENVVINNQTYAKYTLVDTIDRHVSGSLDVEQYTFHFIAGIGATTGGMAYHYSSHSLCVNLSDYFLLTYRGYGIEDFYFLENPKDCQNFGGVGLEKIIQKPRYTINDEMLKFDVHSENVQVNIYNIYGKEMISTKEEYVNISNLYGLHFVKLSVDGQIFTYKVFFLK